MKKVFFTLMMSLFLVMGANAQVTVAEPDFAEQVLLLSSDSTGVLLERESGTVKTKAGASLYLTGIGKVKSRLTLKGVTSASTAKGSETTRLIVKARDNATDPFRVICKSPWIKVDMVALFLPQDVAQL